MPVNASASSSVVAARPIGTARTVAPWTLGLNGQNVAGPSYADMGFANALAAYKPGTLRYPGGTVANFFNWRTGAYESGGPWPGQPKNQADNSLATFAAIARRLGTTPVFDVNVVTWRGRVATDADVPAMIQDTLSLLSAAHEAGLPVRKVELGNELYLTGPHTGNTLYAKRFPTPEQYAAVAERYAKAIHAAYPRAEVAAVATETNYVNWLSQRRRTWNAGLLPRLAATDAVTIHLNVWVADATLSPVDVLGVMSRQIDALKANELPRFAQYGLPVWVTEFNMGDRTEVLAYAGTWLHGMSVGLLALKLLPDARIAQLAMHNVTGHAREAAIFTTTHAFGPTQEPTTLNTPTAAGVVLGLVQDACRGATSLQQLEFVSGPVVGAMRLPGLMGVVATAPNGDRRIVLLNLTSQPLAVDVSATMPSSFSYRMVSAPALLTRITGPDRVVKKSGSSTGTLTLVPYGAALLTS
jgi:hypothetical protein